MAWRTAWKVSNDRIALSSDRAASSAAVSDALTASSVVGSVTLMSVVTWMMTGCVSSTVVAVVLSMSESASTLATVAPSAWLVTARVCRLTSTLLESVSTVAFSEAVNVGLAIPSAARPARLSSRPRMPAVITNTPSNRRKIVIAPPWFSNQLTRIRQTG